MRLDDLARREPRTHRGVHRRGQVEVPKSCSGSTAGCTRRSRHSVCRCPPADFGTIERFHHTFINAGLSLQFESRGRPPQEVYPTLPRPDARHRPRRPTPGASWRRSATFSSCESLEAQDLVVPVVGDLGGTRAPSAIADLMTARGDRLSAFYVSNVETYLFGDKYSPFVKNVARLPRDARSIDHPLDVLNSVSSSEIQPTNQFVSANKTLTWAAPVAESC